jgi:lysophospholipase L1-like esterase
MMEHSRPERSAVRPSGRSAVRNVRPNRRSAEQPNAFPGRLILVALLLCLLVAAGGWYLGRVRGPDLRRVANLDAPGDLVVFFGDSITQGYGVRGEDSFASLAARELGIAFANAGVSGDTMAAGLARMDRDVLPQRPRLTVVEFGGNDFLRRVPVEETLKNLDAIVGRLIDQGSMVVILEVNVGLMGDPYLKGYRAVAERRAAVLIEDIMQGILANPDLKVDGIHPNAQGHRLIAERVVRVLRPLLHQADRLRSSGGKTASDFPLPEFRPVG